MRVLFSIAAIAALVYSAAAQRPDVLLLADGTVNLGAPPGEKGVWEIAYIENIADRVIGSSVGNRTAPGSAGEPQIPFLPWSAALYDYNVATQAKYDPESFCLPPGGPRLFTAPYPMQIIQLPDQKRVFMVFEVSHTWREIYLDGRRHAVSKDGTWLGHSVGRYEDDGRTLAVDLTDFNEGTWLDFSGHPHTNKLHVVERFTRTARYTLHYEATIDDSGAYSHPWTVAWNMKWWPDGELDQYVCEENNKYIHRLKDDFGRPVVRNKG
jgi:hypothetical protein